jgi:hypothetical protein
MQCRNTLFTLPIPYGSGEILIPLYFFLPVEIHSSITEINLPQRI